MFLRLWRPPICMSFATTTLFRSDTFFFFFNDTATTEIYTLSLHDALPICAPGCHGPAAARAPGGWLLQDPGRSEEHTSELQSPCNLVCRLLLEKKKEIIGTSLAVSPTTVVSILQSYVDDID